MIPPSRGSPITSSTGRRLAPSPSPARLLFLSACLAAFTTGCSRPPSPTLRVATDWTPVETDRLPLPPDRPIAWIRVLPGDDPTRLLDTDPNIDLVLGGPWASYLRRDRAGVWHQDNPTTADSAASPRFALVPLPRLVRGGGDPRRDPFARNTFRALLAGTSWPRAYARALAQPLESLIPPPDSSSPADAPHPALRFDPIAIPARAPHPAAALAWMNSLLPHTLDHSLQDAARLEPWLLELAAATIAEPTAERQAVLARIADLTPRAQALLVEPPPWPPASLVRWRRRMDAGDTQVNPWFQNLARELAPLPAESAALSGSWLDPERPIDPDRFHALAAPPAPDLLANPRIRAWLHAEWSAWARQRYRRVLRLVDQPPAPGNPSPGSPPS